MAQNNPFLKSPFDAVAAGSDALLPGQEPVRQAEDLPEIDVAPVRQAAPQPEQRAPAARRNQPQRVLPPAETRPIFEAAAREFDVPVNVLMAIGLQESGYNASAIGQPTQWGRAKGIMQNLDDTARGLGINAFNPAEAIPAAAKQIRERLDKGATMIDAVREHFAGPDRKKWGSKTEAYGNEVMQKVARIGELLYSDADDYKPAKQRSLQEELDAEEPGRYRVLTDDEVAAFEAKQKPVQTVPNPMLPDAPGNLATDTGRNLKIGMNTAAADVRELVGRIPLVGESLVKAGDAVDRYMNPQAKDSGDLLKRDTEAMIKGMTPDAQAAMKKTWWDSDKGRFGDAWSDPRSYLGGIVQSLPEQVMAMAPAMRLAKAAYASKIAAGAAPAVASAAAARAATLAGAVSEGALGGAASSREVRDKVSELPASVLEKSEAFQSLIADGVTPDAARKALADDLATRAFVTSGIATGIFGGMGDRAIAKVFTDQIGGSVVKRVLGGAAKGAVAEGLLEELPQGALQQVAQNAALQQADASVNLSDDVLNQALGGVATGGPMGGVMGGVAGVVRPPAAPSGPLAGALESAADQASTSERITATAPDGQQVSGDIATYQEDGQGGYVAQILTDDGRVVTLDSRSGIQIAPEDAAPAGPLSASLESAVEQAPEVALPAIEEVAQPTTEMQDAILNDPASGLRNDSGGSLEPSPSAALGEPEGVGLAAEPVGAQPAISNVPESGGGAAVPDTSDTADADAPITEAETAYWKNNPYHAYAFPDAERAESFMKKKAVDPTKFEVKQTGKVRWQVMPVAKPRPRAAWQDKVEKQQAALEAQIATANENAAKRKPDATKKEKDFQPINLVRMSNARDFDWNKPKPNGTYASIAENPASFESPFLDEYKDGKRYDLQYTPTNPLEVQDLKISHARFGRLKSGDASAGVKALHALLPKDQFDLALKMSKQKVQDEIAKKFPDVDSTSARDAYEALEIWGAQEASARGHDIIIAQDSQLPQFSEAVLLSGASKANERNSDALQPTAEDGEIRSSTVRGDQPAPTVAENEPGADGSVSPVDATPTASELETDDGSDIPVGFFKKVKVPHDVWNTDDGRYETVDLPADKALASVREDITNLRALLGCLRGAA